jgi:hypothetical protein
LPNLVVLIVVYSPFFYRSKLSQPSAFTGHLLRFPPFDIKQREVRFGRISEVQMRFEATDSGVDGTVRCVENSKIHEIPILAIHLKKNLLITN